MPDNRDRLAVSIGRTLRAALLAALIGSALVSAARGVPAQVAGLRAARNFIKPVAQAPWWSSCGEIPLSPQARTAALQAESSFYWLKAAMLLHSGNLQRPVSPSENGRLRDFYNGLLDECAGQHEEAVAAWRRAGAAPLFVYLGNDAKYIAWRDAVKNFKLALEIDGSLFGPRVTLADTYVRLEQWSDAAAQYRLALKQKPSAADVESGYAYSLYRAGDASETAIAMLRDVVQRNPEERAAYRYLGEILCDKGQWVDATDWYRKAAIFPEGRDDVELEMAKCLLRSRRERDALAVLEPLVERRRGAVVGEVYFFMARARENAGDACGAKEVLRRWAQRYPADSSRWAPELRRLRASTESTCGP